MKTSHDRAWYENRGREAWEQSGGSHPPAPPPSKGWQGAAWKRGFDAAYERERPSLDLDHGIITTYVNPPIPDRNSDWQAVRDGAEPGDLVGRGATEQQAIDDLLEQERSNTQPQEPTP